MSAGLLHRESFPVAGLDVSVSAHVDMVLLAASAPGVTAAVHATPEAARRIARALLAAADAAERAEVEA